MLKSSLDEEGGENLILWIYSKALFSTWIYYSPERVLFDAGEGVATTMMSKVYAIKKIFLTHGHVDHISGIWNVINTRNNAMGDREKPLEVYYPKGNRAIEAYLNFIRKANPDLRFSFTIHPIESGEKVFLREAGSFKRFIVPFKTKHTAGEKSFGYHIYETRRKLKDEYKHLDPKEIASLVKKLGQDAVTYEYDQKLLTVSGDSLALKPEEVEGTELLIHECTFLNSKDRRIKNHASIEEVVDTIKKSGVKNVILYHISTRYIGKIEKFLKKYEKDLEGVKLQIVDPNRGLII